MPLDDWCITAVTVVALSLIPVDELGNDLLSDA